MTRCHTPRSYPLIVQWRRILASRRGIHELDGRQTFAGPPGGGQHTGTGSPALWQFFGPLGVGGGT